jgi:hypothetical protein
MASSPGERRVREVRALLLRIPPLAADLIRCVVTPRLARADIALTLVTAPDPQPDLVIATESTHLPVGIPTIVLSSDLTYILGDGDSTPLTPESLAHKFLERI